ncbi:hypothetical protein MRX96_006564 [Rhipicephalus microplus]
MCPMSATSKKPVEAEDKKGGRQEEREAKRSQVHNAHSNTHFIRRGLPENSNDHEEHTSHGVNPDFFGVASPPHQTLFVNRLRGMCVYDDSPSRLRLKDVTSGTAASKAREKPPPQNQSELPARLRPT